MPVKRPYKYYAIRVSNTVVIRRTVDKLTRVESVLRIPAANFKLRQVSFVGGTILGSIRYREWINSRYAAIKVDGYMELTRIAYKAIKPFLV